jgi:alpha-soluble NSF attachment protein
VLDKAITQYTIKGNFRRAATHKQNLAELYENDLGDNKRAAEAYEIAAGWYEQDNAEALANKLFLKVADLVALEGDYYKAIENYEKVAKSSINHNLMRWSVKEYLFKAGICHLATNDMVGAQQALQKYLEMDPSLYQQREYLVLKDLLEACEQGDQEAFSDKLFQFDQMSKLDKWKTTLLLRVKNNIQEQGEDFS